MPELDIRTLHAILAIVGFSATITLLALWKSQPYKNGMGYIAFGIGCSFLAGILVSLRGVVPDLISIVLGNLLFALTSLYVLKGVRVFTRRPMYAHLEWALPVFFVIYFLYFTYVDPNVSARVLGISTVYFTFSLSIVFNLLVPAKPQWQWSARMVALVYFGFAFSSSVRIYLALSGQSDLPFMETSGIHAWTILMGIFVLGGSALGFSLMSHDALQSQYRILSQGAKQAASSIIITDAAGKIEYVNRAFEQLTGYSVDEVLGQTPSIIQSDQTKPEVYEKLWRELKAGKTWRGEFYNRKKNGELYWEIASISPVKQRNGETTHYIAIKENITELKEAEAKIRHLAMHDSLTGLSLKSLCLDRWQHALALAKRNHTKIALMFVDLDGFKSVNDNHGHSYGDKLLIEIARRIASSVRAADTVCRIGGDEFLIMVEGLKDKEDVTEVASKVITNASRPLAIDDQVINISASLGVSFYPDNGSSFESLLDQADRAMYGVKREGKNGYAYSDTPSSDPKDAAELSKN
ncbi:GGDEF domain-containing protein [Neptunomonas phycophila]|uniref:GGDEF domain-containing protein n=1 Tax=Neptunomonas phycophila TaxID=1572645 RepID=UPI0015C1BC75|nr:GGDEF domain-containing protein [Neptunomonas phycophila]QLE97290.1 diguanylate cyclase [Neptunomonas phycophila]